MNKVVIIPVYGFVDYVTPLINFYKDNLEEAKIMIINSKGDGSCKEFKDVSIIDNGSKITLKNAIKTGCQFAVDNQADMVIINEHDVMPSVDALYASLHAFQEYYYEVYASVSCIYRWDGRPCYPTHPNWFLDQPRWEENGLGRVSAVAGQGVPFGFSLWKTEVIANVDREELPDVWKLDYQFGKMCFEEFGWKHLRLLDYYVEHHKMGVKSHGFKREKG